MRNGRLIAAVTFALVAASAGALSLGLEEPVIGAVAAIAGVLAAALASMGFGAPAPQPAPPAQGAVQPDQVRMRAVPALAGEPEPTERATSGGTHVGSDTPGLAGAAGDLVDPVTGMLDHRYFLIALERRVATSRRKLSPFSLVVLELHASDPETRVGDQSMKVLAAVVRAVLRESDTGCRIDDHTLGLLLEDTPETGAVWATERVRAGFFATTFRGNVKLASGIAAYPAHALEADRLLGAARTAAARSHELGQEAIEVAPVDESAEGAES